MSVRAKLVRLLAALILVNGLLLAPGWILAGRMGPHWLALEAVFLVGLAALLPRRRWSLALIVATVVAVVAATVLELGDTTARLSLARPLNLYLDVHLVSSVYRLLIGTFGAFRGVLIMLGLVLAAAGAVWILVRLLAPAERTDPSWGAKVAGVALVVFFCAGLAGEQLPRVADRVALPTVTLAREQTNKLEEMLGERDRLAAEMAASPSSYADRPGLLERLDGRDVVLAFVESYGMSAVDDPRYAPLIRPRLEDFEQRMKAAGLYLATGTLTAPTQGGQSWLAHETLLSGLWLDNQLRYDLFMASDRETLIDDFEHAGHRTVALMPAITLAWPEGKRLGYDETYVDRDIDYRGPPLNWVTMPDQFTWSYLQKSIRPAGDGRPLFAELGLISSHAPWTPILPVLDDWEDIGNGEVFAPWENAGEKPEELWLDNDKVREHYALSIEYALHVLSEYAARYVDGRTLLIVLGDHQPAPLVTGEDATRAVPVHVIAGDPAVIQPFLDWGFAPGAFPDPDRPDPGMDAFRGWFVRAFSRE